MTETFKVALAGLGTVGGGVVKLLREQSDLLEKRTGRKIKLTAVSDLNQQKLLELGLLGEADYYKDALEMVRKADADLVVELIAVSYTHLTLPTIYSV